VIGVAVIGFGYWGPKLARNLAVAGRSRLIAVCDLDPARLASACELHPGILATDDCAAAIAAPGVDAVVVATPPRTHFEIALAALRAGRHVLVAKPMTETADQARRLIEEAERRRLVLLVDHTFVYAAAVAALAGIVRDGALGTLHYWDSTRVNLGVFRPDTNVLWDLAIHDLAILDHVLAARPLAVSATGASPLAGAGESLA
jgi:predicted dehydrogenase